MANTTNAGARRPELLAPAGEPDSGYAALEYGADALYLGLARFSARAEAVNFSPDELADIAGYAHSLTPRRNIYLTLNTLVQQSELADAAAVLATAAECGVDAVIVQDLGVAKLIRDGFPALRRHASTQMAIHSLEGALAAKALGYSRVTLARELTFDEIADVVAGVGSGLEVETFIHGTLCYSYSGLCLFSSIASGRSGNRGRCVYSCREAAETPAGRAHPFSLKDMALGERVLDLAKIGVASLKIEGRKKSPLYVAATVDHYRRILDGELSGGAVAENEARLKTIFARPWTRFFLDSKRNPDVVDADVVGHRGSRIGEVGRIVRTPAGEGIAFTPSLAVERHDGLQIDIPGEARPFGFGVDNLYVLKKGRMESVFEAAAGTELAVPLPADAPALAPGLPLYLSSSQAVKRAFPFSRPKAGAFRRRSPAAIGVALSAIGDGRALVRCEAVSEAPECRCSVEEKVPAFEARDAAGSEKAARAAFERLGDTAFRLGDWRFDNPAGLFVKPGDWNRLRRRLVEELSAALAEKTRDANRDLAARLNPAVPVRPPTNRDESVRWSLFVERPEYLSAFGAGDFSDCGEVIVGVGHGDKRETVRKIEALASRVGGEKIRLAPPLIFRAETAPAVSATCRALLDAGWRRWMVSGLAGWEIIRARPNLDLAADWTCHVVNEEAAACLSEMGFTRFTFSPEDDADNIARLASRSEIPGTLLVFSHLPLFISAACAHLSLGLCGRKGRDCSRDGPALKMTLERGTSVEVVRQDCGSAVVGEKPYSLSLAAIKSLPFAVKNCRLDFRWCNYDSRRVMEIWRDAKNGKLPEGINGNFAGKLL